MFFAIMLCRLLHFAGSLIGKGSSMPGKIVMTLFPNILSRVVLPDTVIAVTGSNGKTSTVESIAHILTVNGKKVVWNREGSNQTEGVATAILCACDKKGRVDADVLLLETDERYARLTFRFFAPTHFVITNLYRDQMTRNGHNELIYDIISDAVKDESTLILNADDPLASAYGKDHPKAIYYSMDRNRYSSESPRGKYNDSAFCPVCKHPLKTEYRTFENAGRFFCENCGHSSHTAKYRVTDVDLENTSFILDGEHRVSLKYKGLHNIYNYLAAYSVCCEAGIDPSASAAALNDFVMNNGRLTSFTVGTHPVLLLISKHENSVSYNSSIDYTLRLGKKVDVVIMVNAISRKYYTGETSWLYDIDFERLDCGSIGKIVLCGKYCRDLELRFVLGGLGDKIAVFETPEEALRSVCGSENETVIMTCFADRARLMQAVRTVGEEKK